MAKKEKDKKDKGYIKLYRSLQDHWLWSGSEPFDDRSAWVDLLMTVNHEEKKIKVGRDIITIHAGQTWTSFVKLARRWRWSRNRVYRYIKMLISDGMILMDGTPNGTLLTVVNYGFWEGGRNTNGTSDGTSDGTPGETTDGTSGGTQTNTIKNVNTIKNEEERRAAIWEAEGWQ